MNIYRRALRKLCFFLCNVHHPTPGQLDLDVVMCFRDDTYRLATRRLLEADQLTFCHHWVYHAEKQNRAFEALGAQQVTEPVITLD